MAVAKTDIEQAEQQEQEAKQKLLEQQRKAVVKAVRRAAGIAAAAFDPKSRLLVTAGAIAAVELAFGDLQGSMEDLLLFGSIAAIETLQAGAVDAAEVAKEAKQARLATGARTAPTVEKAKEVILRNIPPSGSGAPIPTPINAELEADLFDERLGRLTGIRAAFGDRIEELARPMTKVKEQAVNLVRAELANAAREPLTQKELAARIARALNVPAAQAMTLARTGLAAMGNEVNGFAADRMQQLGIESVWYFDGPAPQRPFCKKCYRRAFTPQQVDALSNGQGLSVRTYCGGYNCTHSWRVMPASTARRLGIRFASDRLVSALSS